MAGNPNLSGRKKLSKYAPDEARMTLPTGEVIEGRDLAFVKRFPLDFDGAAAAADVGFAPNSSKQRAWALLQREDIRRALKYEVHDRFEAAQVSVERVLQEAYDIATANIQDFLDHEGRPIPLHLVPRRAAAAVREIRLTREQDGNIIRHHAEIKFEPKGPALKLLGQYLNMWAGEEKDGGLMPVDFTIEFMPEGETNG